MNKIPLIHIKDVCQLIYKFLDKPPLAFKYITLFEPAKIVQKDLIKIIYQKIGNYKFPKKKKKRRSRR